LTSPFSARSGSFFSRSPSINEHDDMDELRPDSRQDDRSMRADSGRFLKPFKPLKRSCTAPGALDPHTEQEFSIYYIAHNGEAEAYFDTSRNFPSVCGTPDASAIRELEDRPPGWSPSHSVFIPPRTAAGILSGAFVQSPDQITPKAMFQAIPPESAAQATDASSARGSQKREMTVFSSPSEDEMKTTKTPTVSPPSRSYTQVTGAESMMSPMSATPVVQHAHMATLIAPDTSYGELREVDVASRRSSPNIESDAGEAKPAHLGHQRQESYGLGITSEKVSGPPALPLPPRENTGSSSSSWVGSEKDRETSVRSLGAEDSAPKTPWYRRFLPSRSPSDPSEKECAPSIRSLEEADSGPKIPWYRRFFWFIAAGIAALIILMIVLLVLFVPPRPQTSSSNPAVQASWLNTTGFPAIPVGVSTVAQPNIAQVDGSCMPSASLWSCNAGSEQGLGSDADAGIPNFRLQISFLNGTLPSSQTGLLSRDLNSRILPRAERQKAFARNAATDMLFTPVPAPPSLDDQRLIGQTVDGITSAPYEGEGTPFFISLLSPKVLTKRSDDSDSGPSSLSKRSPGDSSFPYPTDSSSSSTSTTTSPTSLPSSATPTSVPPATLQQNGQIAPSLLYPLAAAQPLRLFNRGQATEHYAFYTYYTRIFSVTNSTSTTILTTLSNSTSSSSSNTPAQYALFYTHTRLHIQIWTRRGTLNSLPTTSSPDVQAKDSSANNFTGTGSFPYPVTITLDRPSARKDDGGKGVYAYAVDSVTGKALDGLKGFWVPENGGVGRRDGNGAGAGGGCVCQWTTTT
jgi:hypothetical protein